MFCKKKNVQKHVDQRNQDRKTVCRFYSSEQFLTNLDNIAGTHSDQDITRLAVFEQTGLNLVEGVEIIRTAAKSVHFLCQHG